MKSTEATSRVDRLISCGGITDRQNKPNTVTLAAYSG